LAKLNLLGMGAQSILPVAEEVFPNLALSEFLSVGFIPINATT